MRAAPVCSWAYLLETNPVATRCRCRSGCMPAARPRIADSASTMPDRATADGLSGGRQLRCLSTPLELRFAAAYAALRGRQCEFRAVPRHGQWFQHASDMFPSFTNFISPTSRPARSDGSRIFGTCNFNYFSHAVGMGARYKTRRPYPSGLQLQPQSAGLSGDLRLQRHSALRARRATSTSSSASERRSR